jgi:DNA repair protein SbcD/Mre11
VRLVHFSDVHLGYRQYTKTTLAGINQRETDVAMSFRATISRIIQLAPDLVVIGGDVFHSVRPSNLAIVAATREFARLLAALPRVIVVLVAGNHDMPKVSDNGCILPLFATLGIHVVDVAARRLDFPEHDLSVLGVPDAPGVVRPELVPDPRRRFNVLVMHGEVQGMLNAKAMKGERPAVEISQDEIGPDRWDYIALGHYHVYRELAPNMFYSGSIDYTSSNPWGELEEQRGLRVEGKGIIERDLVTGAHTFHSLQPSRAHIDLGAIDASGMAAADVDAAILERVASMTDGAVARLLVHSIRPDVIHALDRKAIRQLKARALNLNIDFRKPDVVRLGSVIGPALKQGVPLMAIVADRLASRELPSGIDRGELARLAESYMATAQEKLSDDPQLLASAEQTEPAPLIETRKAS